jgi:hypothetical protein
MSRHRIFKTEADQPKPLAYIRMYPQKGRGNVGAYLTAALAGGAVVIGAAAALALIQTGIPPR